MTQKLEKDFARSVDETDIMASIMILQEDSGTRRMTPMAVSQDVVEEQTTRLQELQFATSIRNRSGKSEKWNKRPCTRSVVTLTS